jgi:hypothetical protein
VTKAEFIAFRRRQVRDINRRREKKQFKKLLRGFKGIRTYVVNMSRTPRAQHGSLLSVNLNWLYRPVGVAPRPTLKQWKAVQ